MFSALTVKMPTHTRVNISLSFITIRATCIHIALAQVFYFSMMSYLIYISINISTCAYNFALLFAVFSNGASAERHRRSDAFHGID